MSDTIRYKEFEATDFDAWFDLNKKLFPDYDETSLLRDLKWSLDQENYRSYLAFTEKDVAIGFATVSIRNDYVEGATGSPTGYLDAIYVEPDYRKKGISRSLIRLGEEWLTQRGCTQIGSDTWLWNKDAQNFHEQVGFKEEDRLVHYIKDIIV